MRGEFLMDDIVWPERPTCHDSDPQAVRFGAGEWRPPTAGRSFRSCSYCGSIHPGDLMGLVDLHEVRLESADQKYGWPHKFYITGVPVVHAKWYNVHFADLAGDAFTMVAEFVEQQGGIRFEMKPDGLAYRTVHL